VSEKVTSIRAVPERTDERRRVKIRRPSYDECQHRSTELDERNRTITCLKCGRLVDPFLILKYIAYDTQDLDWRVEAIREFEEKERAKAKAKKDDCVARDHIIPRNRRHCRCGARYRDPGY
jgi:hypothetical protein